jgi:ferrous iron transport protein A
MNDAKADNRMTVLSELAVGETGRIKSIPAESAVNQRLMNLGLLPGMMVKIVQVAPLGDPIAIEFTGQRISIRRSEAALIVID